LEITAMNKSIFWFYDIESGKYLPETKQQSLERINRVRHLLERKKCLH